MLNQKKNKSKNSRKNLKNKKNIEDAKNDKIKQSLSITEGLFYQRSLKILLRSSKILQKHKKLTYETN